MSVVLPSPLPNRRESAPRTRPLPGTAVAPVVGGARAGLRRHVRAALAFLSQVAVVVGLMLAYHFARALADGRTSLAFEHSTRVWDLERMLRLPSELSVQHWFFAHPTVSQAADLYYAGVHFPFTGAVLVYLYLRRPEVYRVMRDVLVLLTASGLVLAFVFPLAPPRMRADLGFTDVAAHFGQSVYGPPGTGTANQFAAMPSLHVGWAVLVGLALVAAGRSRWRWLWLAHPVFTVAVVVGTANHYFADGVVAVLLLVLAALPVLTLDRWRVRRRNHPFGIEPSPGSAAQPALQ